MQLTGVGEAREERSGKFKLNLSTKTLHYCFWQMWVDCGFWGKLKEIEIETVTRTVSVGAFGRKAKGGSESASSRAWARVKGGGKVERD